jgi:hypothetical protein
MRARAGLLVAVAALVIAALLCTESGASPATSRRAHRGPGRPLAGQPVDTPYGFAGDDVEGRITNLTPYPWTFVANGVVNGGGKPWVSEFPATLQPGQSFVYRLAPYNSYATTHEYNGWFSYRANTLNHAEYLTLRVYGSHCTGLCLPRDGPALLPTVWNGTSAPNRLGNLGPATAAPEIGWVGSGNTQVWPDGEAPPFDFTFQTKGNYTLDAAKAPPQLADLINAMCAGAATTKCSFAPTGGVEWGIGQASLQTSVASCTAGVGAQPPPPDGAGRLDPPPADSPDWHAVSIEAQRTRSVSVGGSLALATEVNLFGIIDTEVSLKIGAEHEWAETRTFEKTTRIYIPRGWLAAIWIAPRVGTVSGTLVVSTPLASYTITNFKQTASGVSPDLQTPAFNIMTNSRAMTPAERQRLCPSVGALPPHSGRG